MIVDNQRLFAESHAPMHMGSSIGEGAKNWAAEEGKALGSGVVDAATQKLQELILFGKKGPPPPSNSLFGEDGQPIIISGGPSMNPMVIGGLALAGVLVVALVARR